MIEIPWYAVPGIVALVLLSVGVGYNMGRGKPL